MKEFKKYTIAVEDALQGELLIALLGDLGIDAFEEKDTELIASGIANEIDEWEIGNLLQEQGVKYSMETVADQNWNAVWESSFEPVLVEDFAAIRAAFHQPVSHVQHEIIITPKMSFGTGHHATTWLMMQLMRNISFKDKKVFDFGTGTGVLAILAAKLGAASVLAIDNDEWSINNTMENIVTNGVSNIIVELAAQPAAEQTFDVILANINKHILLQFMPAISQNAVKGSCVLLSGLLLADEVDIVTAAENNQLTLQHLASRNGWLALVFKKK